MRARAPGLVVVSAVVLAGLLSTSAASASNWVTTLSPSSAGKARSSPTPATPGSVTATCSSSGQKTVLVSWAAVPHATYSVYQSSVSATAGYVLVASGVSTTSWTSPSLSNGLTYWFEVSASLGTSWTSPLSSPTSGRLISKTSPNCT